MNKEFIPYEQALELKELGFDEECVFKYYLDRYEGTLYQVTNGCKNFQLYKGSCTAPLYQQAFRWFREKYGLVGDIEVSYHTKKEKHVFAYTIWEGKVQNYSGCNWEVPEEAENACIDKLITLAKQHN